MRPFRPDRNATMPLASLFERRQQDYKSLELAIEAGDLIRAQRALTRCRKDNQEIAAATGISDSSAVGLIGAILLKTDLATLKSAFQTGELAGRTAPLQLRQAATNNGAADDEDREATLFLRDLCAVLQSTPPKARLDDSADDAAAAASDTDGRSYHFCIKQL
jgi:hypothetical protein